MGKKRKKFAPFPKTSCLWWIFLDFRNISNYLWTFCLCLFDLNCASLAVGYISILLGPSTSLLGSMTFSKVQCMKYWRSFPPQCCLLWGSSPVCAMCLCYVLCCRFCDPNWLLQSFVSVTGDDPWQRLMVCSSRPHKLIRPTIPHNQMINPREDLNSVCIYKGSELRCPAGLAIHFQKLERRPTNPWERNDQS